MKFIFPSFIFKVEKWKWNKEYRIYVSNMGNFKDEYKKPIPFKIDGGGYINIKTPYGYKKAHRLVMFTFCPIPNAESLTVDHKNHNKRDNSVYNLEWVTRVENLRRAQEDALSIEEEVKSAPSGIISDGMIFESVSAAADWLLATPVIANNPDGKPNKAAVERKIVNAVNAKTKYFGRDWRQL